MGELVAVSVDRPPKCRQVPLTCAGHTRPVVDLTFTPQLEDGRFYLLSAAKGACADEASCDSHAEYRWDADAARWRHRRLDRHVHGPQGRCVVDARRVRLLARPHRGRRLYRVRLLFPSRSR